MSPTAPSLAQALAGLIEVAQAAGVDEAVARAEGESLAAAVAESATGAYRDWVSQTGGGRGAEDFAEAASRGRRWRTSPTPTLVALADGQHAEAAAYARALGEVCSAAATLGMPSADAVGHASRAAAAQLGAFHTTSSRHTGSAGSAPEAVNAALSGLWQQVMGQLREVSSRIEQSGGPADGSPLDLGPDSGWGPGRFSLDGPPPTGPQQPVTTPSPAPQAKAEVEPEAPEPPAKSVEELLAELDALVGLGTVKSEIHRQAAVLTIEAKRAAAGLKTPDITRHLVFVGNPGTGKTTVARLVAGIYRALGLLSKGQLVEVDRSELVAGYLGQTATKTAEVAAKAVGGVLFIDEAYSLAGDQYGTEAVDTLVKEMEDKRDDLVVIVAGYPVPMQFFVAQNPGLASRFRTTIEFADYTDDELVAIFRIIATGADYDVSDEVEKRFRELLAEVERGPSFGNGRYSRNIFEGAIGHHAWRLKDVHNPTVEQLRTLEPGDLQGVSL